MYTTVIQLSENRTWRNDMEKWTKILQLSVYGVVVSIRAAVQD